jgi:hypothetical protein
MRISSCRLALLIALCSVLSVCQSCNRSRSALQPPPPAPIQWKGEDTGYVGTTVIQPDGTSRPDKSKK